MAKKKNTVRADGRIAVQVYIGRDENGKRKYKTVYGATQKEADEKALEIKILLKKGVNLIPKEETFEVWSERWLKKKSLRIGKSQKESYICYLKHLNRGIGYMPPIKINTYHVQELIDELAECNPNTKKPTAKKTLQDIRNTAIQVFDFIRKQQGIDVNPAIDVEIPEDAPVGFRRPLTEEEISWIIQTPHRMQTAAMIMLFAGLRRGELIPLTWNDINLEKKLISVNKAVELVGKPKVKDKTKTPAGIRQISIPDVLCDHLASITKNSLLVCPSLSGELYTADSWRSSWDSYLYDLDVLYGRNNQFTSKFDKRYKGIAIDRFTPHMLRHTYCTMLYLSGVDVMTAKELMGHSDVKTTLNIYTHLDKIHKQKEIAKLNDFLKCKSYASQTFLQSVDA